MFVAWIARSASVRDFEAFNSDGRQRPIQATQNLLQQIRRSHHRRPVWYPRARAALRAHRETCSLYDLKPRAERVLKRDRSFGQNKRPTIDKAIVVWIEHPQLIGEAGREDG